MIRTALGLMAGTSMDGVDLALIRTDGRQSLTAGPAGYTPYRDSDRVLLREALSVATTLAERTARPEPLGAAERLVTERHVEAVEAFLQGQGLRPDDIDVVGFHGQTVVHRPDRGFTVQIGDGAVLARRIGIPVVADLRAADMIAGGQGAPLVPVYHDALAASAGLPRPLLVLNIGGVSNVTFLPRHGDPLACDTGPGNALLDDLMLGRTGQALDLDGITAAKGQADAELLAQLLQHPFFEQTPPKSLDRNAFSARSLAGLSTEDAAATLTAFTAESIGRILPHLPERPVRVVVCGGGARNPVLMAQLGARLNLPVSSADHLGWNGDAIEAQAFGYLAVRSLEGLPLSFPTTTGVRQAVTGGVLHRP